MISESILIIYLSMETLKNYLTNNNECWDGHIHLFDHSGYIDLSLIDDKYKCVCFADIVFNKLKKYKDDDVISYYTEFINNNYDSNKHILLATGISPENIIELYNTYPNIIKGFGELKCYDSFKNGALPFGNLDWLNPILDFNITLNMPVYIHYDLNTIERRNEFESLLQKYSNMPIVLCHCGMVDNTIDNDKIYDFILLLMQKYSNLYLDISYTASKYLLSNINRLITIINLYKNRVLCGSDINPVIKVSEFVDNPKQYSKKRYSELKKLLKLIDNTTVIKKLFGIT